MRYIIWLFVRLKMSLMLALVVWLPFFFLSLSRYAGRYLWSLGIQVTTWGYTVCFIFMLILMLYLIWKLYANYKSSDFNLTKARNFFVKLSILSFSFLLLTFIYIENSEMKDVQQINQQMLALHQEYGLAAPVTLHTPPVLPSVSELMSQLLLLLILSVVILCGLSIQQTFLLYLCTIAVSVSMVSFWFAITDFSFIKNHFNPLNPHFGVYWFWFVLSGAVLGLACASVIHLWRVYTNTPKNDL